MAAITKAQVGKVFIWLVILTALEVGLTFINMSKVMLGALLLATAIAKAFAVALYFMHLKSETKLILYMVFFPMIIGTLFVLGLVPDMILAHR